MTGKVAVGWIERNKSHLTEVSDRIWALAEVGLQEHRSARLLEEELKKAGFRVTSGVAGRPTAFTAAWGQAGYSGQRWDAVARPLRPSCQR